MAPWWSGGEVSSQLLLLKQILPGRLDVRVDSLDLKPTNKSLMLNLYHTIKEWPQLGSMWNSVFKCKSPNLLRLLHSVSEECGLVLAVVKQDVKGELAANQLVDVGLHCAVEVSDRERVVQHVADLRCKPRLVTPFTIKLRL